VPRWLLWHACKWFTRTGVLLASCWTVQHLLHDRLGYRVDLQTMLVIAVVMIVTVRLWMPWKEDK
jgi:hypothetical protein